MLAAGEQQVELQFTINRLCWLEEITGKPVGEVLESVGNGKVRFTDIRLLVAAASGLEDVKAAGDIVEEAGLEETVAALAKAVEVAFPSVEAEGGAAGKKKAAA